MINRRWFCLGILVFFFHVYGDGAGVWLLLLYEKVDLFFFLGIESPKIFPFCFFFSSFFAGIFFVFFKEIYLQFKEESMLNKM